MRGFLLAAAMFGAVTCAQAADMPDFLRGSLSGGSAPTVNWQGAYVGGQGGLGTSEMNFTGVTQPLASRLLVNTAIENFGGIAELPLGGKVAVHGNGFGGFVGYNGQWEQIVLGFEFNYLHGKFGGSQSDSATRFFNAGGNFIDTVTTQSLASVAISDMGTVRARAGYAWGIFLPYLFGGVALGHADIIRTSRIFGTQNSPTQGNFPFDVTASDNQNNRLIYGYTAGLGVDVMLISCLFLRAEWDYVRYTAVIDTNINTFKVGLGYKF
jgi:outer membrane immunogenic protein